jgi:hypothetical protein
MNDTPYLALHTDREVVLKTFDMETLAELPTDTFTTKKDDVFIMEFGGKLKYM